MSVVIDASLTLAWYFDDETTLAQTQYWIKFRTLALPHRHFGGLRSPTPSKPLSGDSASRLSIGMSR